MTITEQSVFGRNWVNRIGNRLTGEPQSRYFILPSGRKLRIRQDSQIDNDGSLLRCSLKDKTIVMGRMARTYIFKSIRGDSDARNIVRNAVKHEYTHLVANEVLENHPHLVGDLYSAFSNEHFLELGRTFAKCLTQYARYKQIYEKPHDAYRTIEILHEFLAFAAQGEEAEIRGLKLPAVKVAAAIMNELQNFKPELFSTLLRLGLVNNSDFAIDYPIIRRNMEKVALKAELRAQVRRRLHLSS